MSYTSSAAVLQFPSHYVPIEAEEMEYIDGGLSYSSYRGAEAWRKISSMVADVFTWGATAATLARVCTSSVVASATGVGVIAAVASALGLTFAIAATGVQAAMTGVAIYNTRKYGGFQAADIGFFKWNCSCVKRL